MFEGFTEDARQAIVDAQQVARDFRFASIDTAHLVHAVLNPREPLGRRLEAVGISRFLVEATLGFDGQTGARAEGQIPLTEPAKEALRQSLASAKETGCNFISSEHLFLGCLQAEGAGSLAPLFAGREPEVEAIAITALALRLEAAMKQPPPPTGG